MSETNKKWNDESVAKLLATVGDERPVPAHRVELAAEELKVTVRSVAAKLRNLDVEVASMAKGKDSTFDEAQSQALREFVEANAGNLTYKEIADQFPGGFSAKQIQGKILSEELTDKVKATEKVEAARTYSVDEEATFVSMANSGKFIEEIAEALGKSVASTRGKALSLFRSGEITKIPAQKESHAKDTVDPVDALGDTVACMTVAEIAAAVDKTERGVKTLLTRRGIKVKDYDGKSKKEKAAAKAAEAPAA